MAEAGQEKALLVLDRHSGWEVVEELPLDLGPRHHILHAPAASELTELSSALRQGDRVLVVTDGGATSTYMHAALRERARARARTPTIPTHSSARMLPNFALHIPSRRLLCSG